MIIKNLTTKYIGYIFVAISIYYIINALFSLNIDINTLYLYLKIESIFYILIAIILYIFVLYISANIWRFLLLKLSNNLTLPIKDFIHIYAKSNLGKYLPGNIMHLVARNYLAKSFLLTHKTTTLASLLEIVFTLTSGIFILFNIYILLPIKINLTSYFSYIFTFFIIVLFLSTILFLLRKRIWNVLKNINFILPSLKILFYVFIGYLIIYLILGLSQLVLINILGNIEFSQYNYWNILFIFIFSWIVGYVVPGAPGGIGVREAIFIFLFSQHYPQETAILIIITFRFVNIIGDIIFYFLTNLFVKIKN